MAWHNIATGHTVLVQCLDKQTSCRTRFPPMIFMKNAIKDATPILLGCDWSKIMAHGEADPMSVPVYYVFAQEFFCGMDHDWEEAIQLFSDVAKTASTGKSKERSKLARKKAKSAAAPSPSAASTADKHDAPVAVDHGRHGKMDTNTDDEALAGSDHKTGAEQMLDAILATYAAQSFRDRLSTVHDQALASMLSSRPSGAAVESEAALS
ncbi:hypothetical protein AMAG_11229 [Allomyces macrogynus ATCC 38327]|uniref:Uncharacterized protein n=1 Tax=Allomyces macrogynus (strain ATCC 38327) TaxID=578462 RepID=A0A0L0SW40_ALLM3|nr:hypothetical protein AMAG_11229 [Allomyces macrogynus ATCC 38327]|eukprot:KNE66732.1 hypothetical protein AMAG_11229 [Allomyces macrogynus ATCC 38327]